MKIRIQNSNKFIYVAVKHPYRLNNLRISLGNTINCKSFDDLLNSILTYVEGELEQASAGVQKVN